MQTLILSCNTGAGHNSCAQAVQEAYHSRGEICNITDSLYRISALTSQQNKNLVLYAAQMMIYAKNSKKGQKSILKFMFWEPSIMCRSSCKPQTYS